MPTSDTCCTIAPYFTIQQGQLDNFKALAQRLVSTTQTEIGCLHYGFSYNDHEAFCREGYTNAEALLTHLGNIDALLDEALQMAELSRLEVHGKESELTKLREALSTLPVVYYVLENGFRR